MSSPDATPHDGPAGGDPPLDPATFDDDARYARARLGAADPAGAAGDVGSSLAARRQLAARLTPATAAIGTHGAGVKGLDAPTTRRHRSRWLVAPIAAVVALVAGLLFLQPFSTRSSAGAAMLRAAASTTQAAGTARVTATIEAMGQTVSAEGVGDLTNGDGRLTVHAPAPVGDVQLIHLGDDLYLSAPAIVGDLLGGAEWIHVGRGDLESLGELAGRGGLGGLDLSFALDPVQAVDYLRSVSGEVTEVGPDTVGGDPVTHYATHLDPAKLADQLSGEAGGAADGDQLRQALAAVGDIPIDLWIDDAGRLRRVAISVDLGAMALPALPGIGSSGGERPQGELTATFELSAFGAPLDATAPPSGDVAEVGPLLGMVAKAIGH